MMAQAIASHFCQLGAQMRHAHPCLRVLCGNFMFAQLAMPEEWSLGTTSLQRGKTGQTQPLILACRWREVNATACVNAMIYGRTSTMAAEDTMTMTLLPWMCLKRMRLPLFLGLAGPARVLVAHCDHKAVLLNWLPRLPLRSLGLALSLAPRPSQRLPGDNLVRDPGVPRQLHRVAGRSQRLVHTAEMR